MDFKKLAAQYKSELLDSVLPFWLEKSQDLEYGAKMDKNKNFCQCLTCPIQTWRYIYHLDFPKNNSRVDYLNQKHYDY